MKRLGLKVWQVYALGLVFVALALVMTLLVEPPTRSYVYDQHGVHVTTPGSSVVLGKVVVLASMFLGYSLLAVGSRARIAARKLALVETVVDEPRSGPVLRPMLSRPPLVIQPARGPRGSGVNPGVNGDDPFREVPAPPPIVPVQPRLARESPRVQGDPADRPKILT